jgi:hypothetical protein
VLALTYCTLYATTAFRMGIRVEPYTVLIYLQLTSTLLLVNVQDDSIMTYMYVSFGRVTGQSGS